MIAWLCSHMGPHREKKGSYRNGWVLTQRKGLAECPQDRPKGWGRNEQKVHRRRRSTCSYCPPSGLETASSTLWVIGRGDAITSCCTTPNPLLSAPSPLATHLLPWRKLFLDFSHPPLSRPGSLAYCGNGNPVLEC